MGEASYVIGIKIVRDRSQELLGLSKKNYTKKILEKFNTNGCSPRAVPIQIYDKFNLMQCPNDDAECKEMESIPYSSVIGSLNLQTCTRANIRFAVGMLDRYQSSPTIDHRKATKKVCRYLQGTKNCVLTSKRPNQVEVLG